MLCVVAAAATLARPACVCMAHRGAYADTHWFSYNDPLLVAPQIMRILQNIRPDRQTVMFSATFPKSVEILARKVR